MKSNEKNTQREMATAYHEAGHAVMAFALRFRLGDLTIVPEGETLGSCGHSAGQAIDPYVTSDSILMPDSRFRRETERRVLAKVAGDVAESFITNNKHNLGSGSDYSNAMKLLGYLAPDQEQVSAYFDYLWLRARDELNQGVWRQAIDLLARELLDRRQLKSKETKEIITEAIQLMP